jgi:hypothetical protein
MQVNLELKNQPKPVNWGNQNKFPRSASKGMRDHQQVLGFGVWGLESAGLHL